MEEPLKVGKIVDIESSESGYLPYPPMIFQLESVWYVTMRTDDGNYYQRTIEPSSDLRVGSEVHFR
jgi:hypothetical protein